MKICSNGYMGNQLKVSIDLPKLFENKYSDWYPINTPGKSTFYIVNASELTVDPTVTNVCLYIHRSKMPIKYIPFKGMMSIVSMSKIETTSIIFSEKIHINSILNISDIRFQGHFNIRGELIVDKLFNDSTNVKSITIDGTFNQIEDFMIASVRETIILQHELIDSCS